MTGHDSLTLKAAATLCGVSESTIRRNREKLRQYGAFHTSQGWSIPQNALIMAGLLKASGLSSDSRLPPPLETLQNELAEARLEAREWRARAEERDREREQLIKRAESAEATAREATATAAALALTVRELEPAIRVGTTGSAQREETAPQEDASRETVQEGGRGWRGRLGRAFR